MALISSVYGNNVYRLPLKKKGKKFHNHKIDKRDLLIEQYHTELLNKATPAEIAFQHILVDLHIQFVFQKEFKKGKKFAFADFWLPQHKCIVEIDGSYHNNQIQQWKDNIRTKSLVKCNKKVMQVIRFTNSEVLYKPASVKKRLISVFKGSL